MRTERTTNRQRNGSRRFSDYEVGGGVKAIWLIALNGSTSPFDRRGAGPTPTSGRSPAGSRPRRTSPTAKALLDSGTITRVEFDNLKTNAFA